MTTVPGPQNSWRGGPLSCYDAETRATAAELAGVVDVAGALAVWEALPTVAHSADGSAAERRYGWRVAPAQDLIDELSTDNGSSQHCL